MSRPLKVVEKFTGSNDEQDKKLSNVVPISPDNAAAWEKPAAPAFLLPLGDYKFNANTRDSKWVDYLLIGVLSLAVHTIVVEVFKDMSLARDNLVEPVKPPSKVQIQFVQPKPKPVVPPPIVQRPPPPPPPKVVPINKSPKPKVAPKPAPKPVIQPVPNIKPTVAKTYDAPVSAPTAPVIAPPPPPPKPKPVVQEKITQPHGSAGYLNNPPPNYPEIAEERGWDGKVLMKVHVLASGKPDSVSVVKSSGHDVLDNEAVRTVKKWSFSPAKRGETPIDGWVTVPITFNLAN